MPSSDVTIRSTSANGNGFTSSCRRASALRYGNGEQLPELDEGGPQPFEVCGELFRARLRNVGRDRFSIFDHVCRSVIGHEVGTAVPDQQAADVLVPFEVFRA